VSIKGWYLALKGSARKQFGDGAEPQKCTKEHKKDSGGISLFIFTFVTFVHFCGSAALQIASLEGF
jgi:hypothetical protein